MSSLSVHSLVDISVAAVSWLLCTVLLRTSGCMFLFTHSQPWDTLDTSVSLAVLLGLALRAQGEQKAVDVRGGKSGSMIIRILSDFRIIRRDAG